MATTRYDNQPLRVGKHGTSMILQHSLGMNCNKIGDIILNTQLKMVDSYVNRGINISCIRS